jgi:hypothetical protein
MMVITFMLGKVIFSSKSIGSSPFLAMLAGILCCDRRVLDLMSLQDIKSRKSGVAFAAMIRVVIRFLRVEIEIVM